jgi:carbon-monoxide dehydrogenase large subunit
MKSLDVSAAAAAPGVIAALTGADAQADGVADVPCLAHPPARPGTSPRFPRRTVLATDTVRHVGDPYAVIVAESLQAAKDAADLIEADFDPLPAIADAVEAVKPGATLVWAEAPDNVALDWIDGDEAATDAAFAKAAKVASIDIVNNRVIVSSMEPRGYIGSFDAAAGAYTLHASSQGSHILKELLQGFVLKGVAEEKIRVITPDVGGGFGMKIFLYPETILVLWLAKRIGRPVKWVAERTEAFLSDTQGRDNVTHAEMALDKDGRFLGVRVDTVANLGAYLSNFGPYIPTAAGKGMHVGVYDIPAAFVHVRCAFTNTVPVDAYRGAGRPEAAYMIDRLVEAAARTMELSTDEIRRRNFVPPERMPYSSALGLTYDSGEFARNMDDAMAAADWRGVGKRRKEAGRRGRLRGIGMSYYVEICGGAPGVPAEVRFEEDDTVTLIVGTQTNGQGHETAYSQIAAERLGVPFEAITVRQGDTALMKKGSFTGGSRSVPVGGVAAQYASDDAIAKGKAMAGELLEAAAADIEFREGRYVIAGTDRSVGIFEVAKAMRAGRAGIPASALAGEADFSPDAATFPNGCHICEVEIDPDTGHLEIVRYTVVDDFGKIINPLLLAGQVHGGIAQGLGQALLEGAVYDEGAQLVTGSYMDYAMPRADNLPPIDFRWNEIPCRTNPLGIKGCGEAGAIGAPPAVINAIIDALAPYGVTHIDMPATPQRIWQTIEAHKRKAAAE